VLLLAADVGGTKTNVALFRAGAGGGVEMVGEESVPNAGHAGIAEVLGPFAERAGRVEAACLGVAGPVAGGRAHMPNLGWTIDAGELSARLGVPRVALLNDLEATAYGIAALAPDGVVTLNPGVPSAPGNRALIAAGTGLGEALLVWDGARYVVSASEGGHADFGPRNAEQIAILERLAARFGHVSYERLVSGPGLANVYDALDEPEDPAVAARLADAHDRSAAITVTALAGTSRRCVRALDVFVDVYGAEAGNLALKGLARGGLWVGGGIAPKILPKLQDGRFLAAFCDKGRFADLMRGIPVHVIRDDRTALRGAAAHLVALVGR
jgi:glucokinase